jgi:small ligand-binding sensory domain FIST
VRNFGDGDGWRAATGVAADEVETWITLANPFGVPVEPWMNAWNAAFPGVPSLGGLGSGGPQGEEIFCFHDRELIEGGVALGFSGGVRVETLVSQGCRPIGEPLTVTGANENFVLTLGSRPAYKVLVEIVESLPPSLRERASGNLFAGLAVSEYVDEFKTGDFLVRNLLGADPDAGAVAIGAHPRVGQTLQFQIRDFVSADEELVHLTAAAAERGVRPFAVAGFRLQWPRPSSLWRTRPRCPPARAMFRPASRAPAFSATARIGPVGGRNFIHGYTASIALFADKV